MPVGGMCEGKACPYMFPPARIGSWVTNCGFTPCLKADSIPESKKVLAGLIQKHIDVVAEIERRRVSIKRTGSPLANK